MIKRYVFEKGKKKSVEDLARQNEELREELTNTQLALCDIYEALMSGGGADA